MTLKLHDKVEQINSHSYWGRKGRITKIIKTREQAIVRWEINWNNAPIRNHPSTLVKLKNLIKAEYKL